VKDMALKRCIRTEILWNKKEASRDSPEMTDMRRPRSGKKEYNTIVIIIIKSF